MVGGVSAEIDGGQFGHGFLSSMVSQSIGTKGVFQSKNIVTSVVSNAILQGSISELTGGKFANGAMTAAFRVAFNDGLSSDNAKNRQVSVDPNFEGPLSPNDTANINAINQSLSDLRDALNMKGDINEINKFNSLKLHYSPDGSLMTESDSAAESLRGGNEINFGPLMSSFRNKYSFGNYHGTKWRGGSRGTMAWVAAHEFGHSMDNNSYPDRYSSRKKIEKFANSYVGKLLPYYNKIGINTSNVEIPGY